MRLVALLLLSMTLASGEDPLEVRSGPFEVLTDAGGRAAGRAVAYCEQLRGAHPRRRPMILNWPSLWLLPRSVSITVLSSRRSSARWWRCPS